VIVPGGGPTDPESAAAGDAAQNADAPGDDDDDAGDDDADDGNDPGQAAEREPDLPSDPDAQ
jgi:hypothetical protein